MFLLTHPRGEPVNLATGITKNDSLGDGKSVVEIRQSVQLPFLLLDVNVELLDTLKSELLFLDEDSHGVTHKLPCNF